MTSTDANRRRKTSSQIVGACDTEFFRDTLGALDTRDSDALPILEEVIKQANMMWTIRYIAPYVASVAFAAIGAILVIFAPESRALAANIGATALLLLAAGLAGYERIAAKIPGWQINAAKKSN